MRRADVIVPVYGQPELTRRCLDSVLANSGRALRRLIVVDDCGPDVLPMLRALRDEHVPVRLLENEKNLGFVGSVNRGIALRGGDVVVLNSDTRVTPGWLDELLACFDDSRVAAASPLSNNGTLCSVPTFLGSIPPDDIDPSRLQLGSLPRFTPMPTAVGFCMSMRGEVIDAIGAFDRLYGRGYNEENDWCQRARGAGFLVGRANRAFVFHEGQASFGGARNRLEEHNLRRLVGRFPQYIEENALFSTSPEAHEAARAVRRQLSKR